MATCEAQPTTNPVPEGRAPGTVAESAGLPVGFPKIVDSPLAWTGAQFTDEGEYIVSLTEQDLAETETALESFKALGLDGDLVTRDNFSLPTLGKKLAELRCQLHEGRGFGVIRGLNPQKHSVEDFAMLHLGLQTYVANQQGKQDNKGNMLVHVVADNNSAQWAGHHRHSTSPITFHNEEAGDIVSWLTKSTAVSGGRCIIASCYTVYKVLANDRPDLVRALAGSDWPFALPHFECRPVLFHHDGKLIMNFGRTPLLGNATHPRPANLPTLNARQLEALDAIESISRATELQITTRPGDIHFINNLAVFHRREGFVNGSSASERRHLVRMRLRDEEMGWAIPDELKGEWTKAFGNPQASKVWHLEPMPTGYFPLRKQPN